MRRAKRTSTASSTSSRAPSRSMSARATPATATCRRQCRERHCRRQVAVAGVALADIERLGAREEVEDAVDVLFARRMTEDAETQRRHAVHTRRRDQAEAALLEGRDEAVDVGAVSPA